MGALSARKVSGSRASEKPDTLKAEASAPRPIDKNDAEEQQSRFKLAGGSAYNEFNKAIVKQAINTGWHPIGQSEEARDNVTMGALAGMMGLAPKDEIEGMLAAQMIATHNASMECFRRAMIPEQTVDGRDMNLTQANKLTRSYATLVHALDKHRGKGNQTVRVEHVNVYDGGQAIVGSVRTGEKAVSTARPSGSSPRLIEQSVDEPLPASMFATRGECIER